jgi:hypothetical protein
MNEYQVSIAATPTDNKGNPLTDPITITYWVMGDDEVEAIRHALEIIDAKRWQTKEDRENA